MVYRQISLEDGPHLLDCGIEHGLGPSLY